MEAVKVRRSTCKLLYNGKDISADIAPILISLQYTENASDAVDDLEISVVDEDDRWINAWYPNKGATLEAEILLEEEDSTQKLKCGKFSIDTPNYQSPNIMVLKATSAALNNKLRRESKARQWKSITLKQLVQKISQEQNTEILFLGQDTPPLSKTEQKDETDLAFLLRQCRREGYRLKVDSNRLVVFPMTEFDKDNAVVTLNRRNGIVLDGWSFEENNLDYYSECKVSYKHPDKGLLSVIYKPENASDDGHLLKIREHVTTEGEALRLAKARLERANRDLITASLTTIGKVDLISGVNVNLSGWGVYDGKYSIEKSVHSVSSGYTTALELVKII